MIANRKSRRNDEAAGTNAPPVHCRNCNHPIHLKYCPSCGQHFADHNTKLWTIIQEFSEEFVRLDSKFLRTIIPLVIKPGFLTREWVLGKRVRYITPLKVYITISAIAFLILSYKVDLHATRSNHFGLTINSDGNEASQSLLVGPTDNSFESFVKRAALKASKTDQSALLQRFMDHLPTASLLIVPIASLLFSFLYIRRSRYYVEHLVFTLHFNSFCLLAITAANVIPGGLIEAVAAIWIPVYLFLALKRNYGQGWFKTLFKFGIFSFAYIILISLAAGVTLLASAMMATDVPANPTSQKAPSKSASADPAANKPLPRASALH